MKFNNKQFTAGRHGQGGDEEKTTIPALDELTAAVAVADEPPILRLGDEEQVGRIWHDRDYYESPKPEYLGVSDGAWWTVLHLNKTYYETFPSERHALLKKWIESFVDCEVFQSIMFDTDLVSPYARKNGRIDLEKTDRRLFYKGDLNCPPISFQADIYAQTVYNCKVWDLW